MKIFLATSFHNQATFTQQRKHLVALGHEVYDWTLLKPIRPYPQHANLTEQYAITLLEEVIDADLFILLANDQCKSSYVELGAAIQANRQYGKPDIYVIGNYESMYFLHPAIKLANTIDDVLAAYERGFHRFTRTPVAA